MDPRRTQASRNILEIHQMMKIRCEAVKGTHEKAKRTRDRMVRIVEPSQTSKTLRIADDVKDVY